MKKWCMIIPVLLGMILVSCGTAEQTIPSDSVTETQGIVFFREPYATEETFLPDAGEHTVQMLFVRAGKADCTVLEADGRTYLIDTGEDSSVPQILAALAYMETESIEGIFLTHTDKDHIGGWDAVLQAYPVGTLYTAAVMEAPEVYDRLAEDIPHVTLAPGQSVPIGEEGLYLDVLCPFRLYPEEENNNSLVLRLDCGEETVLFTGDMKEEEEADLLSTGYRLDCTILKAPYHGRKNSAGTAFLESCTPEVSIVCSDTETDPDTAHKKAMERLRQYGDVYRTEDADLGWYVTLDSQGHTVSNVRIRNSPAADLTITEVSIEKQTIVIRNDGDPADLDGCYLYSDRGHEVFVFPENTVLAAGESMTVGVAGSDADLLWEGETSVWHKSKEDNAVLYDRWGNMMDREIAR